MSDAATSTRTVAPPRQHSPAWLIPAAMVAGALTVIALLVLAQ